jgi:hemolysin activation/secretion protein
MTILIRDGRRRHALRRICGARLRRLERGAAVLLILAGPCWAQTNSAPASTAAGAAAVPAGSLPAKQPHFDIMEYRVLGNTVLSTRDIESLLYPLLGNKKQLTDVEAARAALEKLYHDHGYGTVFVDIPAQEVNDGIVRLHVTEATLNARKIEGARYFSEGAIIAALPAAQVGAVPSLTALQQQLAAVNSATADRSVVPVLKAGPVPGTLDLDLKVTDHLPLHGSVELDDNYTSDTKPLRATVALSYGNLFQALDLVSVQYQDSPQSPGQVSVLDASYTSRPFLDGYHVSGYFINSNSSVSDVGAGAVGVLGDGQITGLRFSAPALTSDAYSQLLTVGLDYKHFRNVITQGGGSAPLVTPISYTNLSLTYTGTLHEPKFDAAWTISPNVGLRGAPNSAEAFENDRYLGRPNYAYVRWDASVGYHAPAGFLVTFRLAGQDADGPLISNENYSVAGTDGVRGYLEAEELGDTAVKGTVQVQTPTWSWPVPQLINAFVFFDAGHIHEFATLGDQPEQVLLDSWGGGINLLPNRAVNGSLTWADPLKDGAFTLAGQWRLLFSVRGAF